MLAIIKSIPQDKVVHMLAGFTIVTLFQFSYIAMAVSVIGAAYLKEAYDRNNGGIYDWKDFVSTLFGGSLGMWTKLAYSG